MPILHNRIALFRAERGMSRRELADAVAAEIASGALKAGDRLPPQRDLAQQVGVDLTTVTRAFAELRQADLYALPMADDEADAAILHHVLHFAQQPGAAINRALEAQAAATDPA